MNILFIFNEAVIKFPKASLSLLPSLFLKHENVIGKWSVEREVRASVFLIKTCIELGMQ